MGIVECKRMFLVIESGSNNNLKQDDLHPCPFSDITMLLRNQGRGVPHPGPTIMLKLYFARHTLTVGIVWEVWGGGYGLFSWCISCWLFLRRKNSWKEILGEKNSRKKCLEKKSITYQRFGGKKSYPSQITHTPSKVKWSVPYNTCGGVHVAKIFSILKHLKTWSKRFLNWPDFTGLFSRLAFLPKSLIVVPPFSQYFADVYPTDITNVSFKWWFSRVLITESMHDKKNKNDQEYQAVFYSN